MTYSNNYDKNVLINIILSRMYIQYYRVIMSATICIRRACLSSLVLTVFDRLGIWLKSHSDHCL